MQATPQFIFFPSLVCCPRQTLFCILLACSLFPLSLFSQFKTYTPKEGLSDKNITCFWRDKAGFLWIGTENGLNRFNGLDFEVFMPNPKQNTSLSNAYIFDLAEDKDGKLWVATRKGLAIFDPKINRFSTLLESTDALPNDWVNTVFINANNEIWISCNNRDICQYHPETCTFTSYKWKEFAAKTLPQFASKGFKNIDKIENVATNVLGLQTNLGYFHFHTQSKQFQFISSENPKPKPYKDKQGFIWEKNQAGFTFFDPFLPHFYQKQAPNLSAITIQKKDGEGNTWLAEKNKGLLLKEKGRNDFRLLNEKTDDFLSTSIMDIFEDSLHKTIWIATEDYGLYRYDLTQKKFTLYRNESNNPSSFPAFICYQIAQDLQGNIWIATDPGGLACFDYASNSFSHINTENGLPSDIIYGLITDKKGNIWANTDKGLVNITLPSKQMRIFTDADGLLVPSFKARLSLDNQGNICFDAPQYPLEEAERGQIGLYFNPDSVRGNPFAPPIFFQSFNIFDKPLALAKNINYCDTISLSYKDNFFSFEMVALNMSRAERNEYAYQLVGYDEKWIYSGSRRYVAYTNVPPGYYTLHIKAANNDKVWNETGRKLVIHIVPPFWQTLPFYITISLIVICLSYFLYTLQIRRIRREDALKHESEKLKIAFNQKLAEAEMSALRAQMNPHFIFNVLTSINRYIVKNEAEKASDYLNQFSVLIRRILDNSRKDWVTLAEEIETLRLYMEIEQLRFSDTFSYEIIVGEELELDFLEIPPMLIQPYIENAIWHGLMQKTDKNRKLLLSLHRKGEQIQIIIEDNGIGRKNAQALKSKSATLHKSHGLTVTSERIQLVNTLYNINCSVEIEDLAEGTRVVLCLGI